MALGLPSALFVAPVPAEALGGDQVWVARYDGPGDFLNDANDLVTSPDGKTVYVTGLSDGTKESGRYPLFWADYATAAYDASTGTQLWVSRYDGPGDGWDNARSIAVSPDGARVYVTGGSRGRRSGQDFATVAYDAATGTQLWVARNDGPAHRGDTGRSVVVTPDGSQVIVSGYSVDDTSHGNLIVSYATVAYDAATGEQLWARRASWLGNRNYAFQALMAPDGRTVFVTGWGGSGETGPRAETIAYDLATGATIWSVRADDVDAGYAAAMSPDGSTLYVTGVGQNGYATVAYDASTGAERWETSLPVPGGGQAYGVAVSSDGTRVYVTGLAVWHQRKGCYYSDDYTTVVYDAATGTQVWVARYNGPGKGEDDALAVATSPDGSQVYVTGESAGFGGVFSCVSGSPRTGQDYATVAYDATSGQQIWVQRYDSPERGLYDSAHAIAVGRDGAIFVTGESHGGGYRDYATIGYSPT